MGVEIVKLKDARSGCVIDTDTGKQVNNVTRAEVVLTPEGCTATLTLINAKMSVRPDSVALKMDVSDEMIARAEAVFAAQRKVMMTKEACRQLIKEMLKAALEV